MSTGAGVAGRLDRALHLTRRQVVILSVLMLAPVVAVALCVGLAGFSPDSWSYFELSKSVFSDRFYSFNTYRSYFSDTYSASFPLGYPVLLGIAGTIFGADPWRAVLVNLGVAVASWCLVLAICRKLGIASLHALALCATLVLFPGYLDEIYTGRAIPAAILMMLLGVLASLHRPGFLAGLFIGLSALFRFDFLPHALLVLAFGSLIWTRAPGLVTARLGGFLVGLGPWVGYSWLHFGRLWVSDNSWVALSATPAFVLDFPAKPAIHAFADPLLWLRRVAGNGNDVLWALVSNLWQVPALVGLAVLLAIHFGAVQTTSRKRLAMVAVACGLAVSPYLLTGYFDARYFAFLYLVVAFAMAGAMAGCVKRDRATLANIIAAVSLLAALAVAGLYDVGVARKALANRANEARTGALIAQLAACQRGNDRLTYVFTGKQGIGLVFRYGAVTGQRAAAVPSNFDRLSGRDRQRFLDSLAPYRLIERLPEDIPCKPD